MARYIRTIPTTRSISTLGVCLPKVRASNHRPHPASAITARYIPQPNVHRSTSSQAAVITPRLLENNPTKVNRLTPTRSRPIKSNFRSRERLQSRNREGRADVRAVLRREDFRREEPDVPVLARVADFRALLRRRREVEEVFLFVTKYSARAIIARV